MKLINENWTNYEITVTLTIREINRIKRALESRMNEFEKDGRTESKYYNEYRAIYASLVHISEPEYMEVIK